MTLRDRWWYSRACSFRRNQRVARRQSDEGAFVSRCFAIKPAINCLSCGGVSAGVWIFSPPRLLIQEPRCQHRESLVMMPSDPVPHLVVGQARLPLGVLDAFLDPVRRLGHTRKFLQRQLRSGVRQIIIMLE